MKRMFIKETLRATFTYPRVWGYFMVFVVPALALWVRHGGRYALLWLIVGILFIRFTLDELRG